MCQPCMKKLDDNNKKNMRIIPTSVRRATDLIGIEVIIVKFRSTAEGNSNLYQRCNIILLIVNINTRT